MRRILFFLISPLILLATIHVDKNEVKRGDVVCVGDRAVVEGKVNGDLVAIKCDLTFSGRVNGDLVAIVSSVEATEGSKVNGDLVMIFSKGETRGIKVNGSRVTVFGSPKRVFHPPFHKPEIIKITGEAGLFNGFKFIFNLLFWGLFSLLVFLLFQKNIMLASSVFLKDPLKMWIYGILLLLVYLILLIIFAVLSVLIIGIPFLLILILLLLAALFFGYTVIFYGVGKLILNSQAHPIYALLLGMVLFAFLNSLYLMSSLVSIVMFPIAMGMSYLTRFGRRIPS